MGSLRIFVNHPPHKKTHVHEMSKKASSISNTYGRWPVRIGMKKRFTTKTEWRRTVSVCIVELFEWRLPGSNALGCTATRSNRARFANATYT